MRRKCGKKEMSATLLLGKLSFKNHQEYPDKYVHGRRGAIGAWRQDFSIGIRDRVL
jgi:hypothetical protein